MRTPVPSILLSASKICRNPPTFVVFQDSTSHLQALNHSPVPAQHPNASSSNNLTAVSNPYRPGDAASSKRRHADTLEALSPTPSNNQGSGSPELGGGRVPDAAVGDTAAIPVVDCPQQMSNSRGDVTIDGQAARDRRLYQQPPPGVTVKQEEEEDEGEEGGNDEDRVRKDYGGENSTEMENQRTRERRALRRTFNEALQNGKGGAALQALRLLVSAA